MPVGVRLPDESRRCHHAGRVSCTQTHSHTAFCHPFISLETLLEYLKPCYIRVVSLCVQVPGLLTSFVCVCVCARGSL